MNRFDKESRIIDLFQHLEKKDIVFMNCDKMIRQIFNSIYKERRWKSWIDSSSKKSPPPDFYNEDLKTMMDVMRIDDHAYEDEKGRVINPTNRRESELIDELSKKNIFLKKAAEEGRLIINADSGLRGELDHNYSYYYKNFNRVIKKHIKKIPNYKKNHPNYKTVFFILDESTSYIQCVDDYRPSKPGDKMYGNFHFWMMDNNMLSCFKDSDVDYIIWFSPYKHFDSIDKKIFIPFAAIIDAKKIDYDSLIQYNSKDMCSTEA